MPPNFFCEHDGAALEESGECPVCGTVWAIRGTDAYNESLREAQYEEQYHERREVQQ